MIQECSKYFLERLEVLIVDEKNPDQKIFFHRAEKTLKILENRKFCKISRFFPNFIKGL